MNKRIEELTRQLGAAQLDYDKAAKLAMEYDRALTLAYRILEDRKAALERAVAEEREAGRL